MTELPSALREYLAKIGSRGGKVGGKSRSKSKVAAARRNGKLGGRPKSEKKGAR